MEVCCRGNTISMDKHIEILSKTALFSGYIEKDIPPLLKSVNARLVNYDRDELIIHEGDNVECFGLLLCGEGHTFIEDPDGRHIIMTLLSPGSEISVMLASSPNHMSPVSVQVRKNSVVLLIPFKKIISCCDSNCPGHAKLIRNFIGIVAEKGLALHERLNCLLKPTVREKILSFLIKISEERNNCNFTIPMDRAELARYLNVDRSALSRELSRMKKDGLIDYYKNSFKML